MLLHDGELVRGVPFRSVGEPESQELKSAPRSQRLREPGSRDQNTGLHQPGLSTFPSDVAAPSPRAELDVARCVARCGGWRRGSVRDPRRRTCRHRDLEPSNVLVTPEGRVGSPRLRFDLRDRRGAGIRSSRTALSRAPTAICRPSKVRARRCRQPRTGTASGSSCFAH